MRRARLIALAGFLALGLPSCDLDDFELFLDLFPVVDLAASDDPEVRATAERVAEEEFEERAFSHYSDFLEGGDPADLQEAINLQPDKPSYRAMAVALARLDHGEDSAEFEAAKRDLLIAEAKSMKSRGHPLAADTVEGGAQADIARQQHGLLNALHPGWETDPPGPGDDPRAQELCRQYSSNPARRLLKSSGADPDYPPCGSPGT